MKRCVIYLHLNRTNDKRYIGWAVINEDQTPHDAMMRRWKTHCKNSRSDLFANAIRKYGEETFDHRVLDDAETKIEAKQLERFWIAELKTCAFDHPDTGYNMTRGGDGGGLLGHVFSKEHRAKISAALKGKPMSLESRKHLSQVKKGKPSTFKGKRHSTESLALQSKNARHAKLTDEQRQHVIARWANRANVRVTQHQLAHELNVSQSAICRLLTGQTWVPTS